MAQYSIQKPADFGHMLRMFVSTRSIFSEILQFVFTAVLLAGIAEAIAFELRNANSPGSPPPKAKFRVAAHLFVWPQPQADLHALEQLPLDPSLPPQGL